MCEGQLNLEVVNIKKHTKDIRKKRFYSSKLDKYHDEIIGLQQRGVTVAQITRWLADHKKVKVVWSTVDSWLCKHTHG